MYQVHWRDSPRAMDCSPVFTTREIAKRWIKLRSIAEQTAIEGYTIHEASKGGEFTSWLPKGWLQGLFYDQFRRYIALPPDQPDHPDHNEYGEIAP